MGTSDDADWPPLFLAPEAVDAEALIAGGADVHAKNEKGMTPLYIAVLGENAPVIEVLLAHGADVNARDESGMTPLHWASFDSPDMVRLLLARGANVDARDDAGLGPLHYAAGRNRADIAALLIAAGADVSAKSGRGETAIQVARRSNGTDVVQLLSPLTPMQIVTANTIRDAGRTLAERMGKTFLSTGWTTMDGDTTEVHFVCEDGRYRGISDEQTIEIYEDRPEGKLVYSGRRN